MTSADQLRQDTQTVIPVLVCFLLIFLFGAVVRVIWPLHFAWGLLLGVAVGPVVGVLIKLSNDSISHQHAEVAASQTRDPTQMDLARDDAKLYLDGKMQRYWLLFSVNGGVFAIVQILQGKNLPINTGTLSMGAAAFTVLMTMDIWLWGSGMRKHSSELFRPMGQLILLMIGALLFAGWFIAWTQRG
jgi:hypothetical protein